MKIVGLAGASVLALFAIRLMADPLPAEIALARRLFAEARAAETNKDWSTAAAKLRDAIAIKETAGLRFHLAYCEEQQGMLVEALNDYERAEDLLTQPNDDFRTQLPSKKESLHKRIPTITLVMPPEVTDANLVVDDHPLSSTFLGKAIPLNPGRHTVVVSSPNRTTFTAELALNETDAVVTNAPMLPVAKAPTPPPLPSAATTTSSADSASAPAGSHARTYVLIGEAAMSVGALALGIGYTVAASSKDSQAADYQAALGRNGCGSNLLTRPPACDDLKSTLEDARNDRFVATVGFIGAGVGAAATAATFILWPAARAKVAITPLAVPRVAGLSVAGRF
jgi:tetratricopeptide (TPR) repeat protein